MGAWLKGFSYRDHRLLKQGAAFLAIIHDVARVDTDRGSNSGLAGATRSARRVGRLYGVG